MLVCSLFVHCPRFMFIAMVRGYQRVISPLSKGACRYYPSCSEYALWLLRFENPFVAVLKSCARVLACNQLFCGGIDYPQVTLRFKNVVFEQKFEPESVKYWLVPSANVAFLDIMGVFKETFTARVYIIKSFSLKAI